MQLLLSPGLFALHLLLHIPILASLQMSKIHKTVSTTVDCKTHLSLSKKVRSVLRCELNSNLGLVHPEIEVTYLAVPQVVDAATAVFEKCREGEDPLYTTGDWWCGWEKRDEKGVQRSLEECVSKFMKFLDEAGIESPSQRRFVSSPNTPIPGPVNRKPDLCVASFSGESAGVSDK